MDEHERNRAAQLRLLTQTAPETPMGKLLRLFWHPVAIAAELEAGTARPLRIMSEDLTLSRDERGRPSLDGGACTRPDGYPLHDYHGLLFAYLGEGEPPPFDLPRKDALERPGIDISTHAEVWDCNWLQQSENSLDATHLSFVHQWPEPSRLGEEIGGAIPELKYEETEAGIRQTAIRPNSVRISNWTFPNNNHVLSAPPRPGDPWVDVLAWQVPIDDEQTLRISLLGYPGGEAGESLRRNGAILTGSSMAHAKTLFEEHRLPDVPAADRIMAQDYTAVRGQGVIQDRTKERLGASDAGIALLRRIIFRELDLMRAGKPTKRWKKIDAPAEMQRLAPVSSAS